MERVIFMASAEEGCGQRGMMQPPIERRRVCYCMGGGFGNTASCHQDESKGRAHPTARNRFYQKANTSTRSG